MIQSFIGNLNMCTDTAVILHSSVEISAGGWYLVSRCDAGLVP
jgi:hypothetical protein